MEFTWGQLLPDKITTKVKLVEDECLTYRSFNLNGEEFTVGDHVLIRNGRFKSVKNCYVARVKVLYDTGVASDYRHRAIVQWYCRIEDLNKKLIKQLKKYPQAELPWQEVFADRRNACVDDIDAETIFKNCTVIKIDTQLNDLPSLKNEDEMVQFFVRWKYLGNALEPVIDVSPRCSPSKNVWTSNNEIDEFSSDEFLSTAPKYSTPRLSTFKVKTPNKDCNSTPSSSRLKLKLVRLSTYRPRKVKYSSPNSDSEKKVLSEKNVSITTSRIRKKLVLEDTCKVVDRQSSSGRKITPNKKYFKDEKENKVGEVNSSPISQKSGAVHLVRTPTKKCESIKKASKNEKFEGKNSDDENQCSPAKRAKPSPPPRVITTRSGRKVNIRLWNDGICKDIDENDSSTSESCDESGDSEEERRSKTVRRRINISSKTPRSRISRRLDLTPSMPCRVIDFSLPTTEVEQAQKVLHVSSLPDALPCREKEYAEIYTFIEGKLLTRTGGCMYISGVPGTGKTATVTKVIQKLQNECSKESSFKFISINGMKTTEPRQAYVQIYKNIFNNKKASPTEAVHLLCKYFEKTKDKNRQAVVLLVDELDLLWNRKQDVLYNIFNWPLKSTARLVVIAIANTMDLPERVMKHRIVSRVGLTRITFQPYTFRQLQEIILARLNGNKVFESDSVQFIARKVAAVSGDARRALDICRRAAELIGKVSGSPTKKVGCVGMSEADKAINEMFSSPKIEAIRNASLQEQTFLKAVVCEFQRTGLEETTFTKVFRQHLVLCRVDGMYTPNPTQALGICASLGSCSLLTLENAHRGILQRVKLNISTDDVTFALRRTN